MSEAMTMSDVMGYNPNTTRDEASDRGQIMMGKPTMARVAKVRARATVRVTKSNWVEVRLQFRLDGDSPWLNLTHPERPLVVARQFGGADGTREARELYVLSALKQVMGAEGATVLELAGSECREGSGGVTEWRYWAHLGAGLSVALRTNVDGTVTVLGLN